MQNKQRIKEAVQNIQDSIAKASLLCHRDPREIIVMAVSKNAPVEDMIEVFHEGIQLFGENRVHSALPKIRIFRDNPLYQTADFHFIGHLQSNKMNKIVPLFSTVQSVSSLKLATDLNQRIPATFAPYPVLLEIKCSDEKSKVGWFPEVLLYEMERLLCLKGFLIRGLMSMAPFVDDEKKIRDSFRTVRQLKDFLEKKYAIQLPVLSMGMSRDYTIAIEEGSTMVRIGNAIFGG